NGTMRACTIVSSVKNAHGNSRDHDMLAALGTAGVHSTKEPAVNAKRTKYAHGAITNERCPSCRNSLENVEKICVDCGANCCTCCIVRPATTSTSGKGMCSVSATVTRGYASSNGN